MAFDLGSLLSQFANAATAAKNGNNANAAAPAGDVSDHFDQAAQNAPSDLLSQGLAAMLRSSQTPPFAQAAAQMFGQANPNQQAGMLNHLLSGIGPSVLASIMRAPRAVAWHRCWGRPRRRAAALRRSHLTRLPPSRRIKWRNSPVTRNSRTLTSSST